MHFLVGLELCLCGLSVKTPECALPQQESDVGMLQEAPSLRIIVVFSTMPLLHEFSITQSDRKSLSFQAR